MLLVVLVMAIEEILHVLLYTRVLKPVCQKWLTSGCYGKLYDIDHTMKMFYMFIVLTYVHRSHARTGCN